MSIVTKVTIFVEEVRPSKNIPFYTETKENVAYFQKYNDVRIGSGGKWNYSTDKLTRTTYMYFTTMEAWNQYRYVDPVVINSCDKHLEYNAANNIVKTVTVTEKE